MRKQCAIALIAVMTFSSIGLTSIAAQPMRMMPQPHLIQALGHESAHPDAQLYSVQYRDNNNSRRGGNHHGGNYGQSRYGNDRDAFRDRSYWDRRHGRGYYNSHYGDYRRDNGSAIAAGFLGLVLGAAIAGSSRDRDYAQSRMNDGDYVSSCSKRYKSFDRSSGTYLGYDGYRHYCL